jgi:hypothetical protein
VQAPEARHRLAVHQLEDPLLPVAPLDVLGAAVLVLPSKKQGKSQKVNLRGSTSEKCPKVLFV